jgi:hypothetical protein
MPKLRVPRKSLEAFDYIPAYRQAGILFLLQRFYRCDFIGVIDI